MASDGVVVVFASLDPVHNVVQLYGPAECRRLHALYRCRVAAPDAASARQDVSLFLGPRCFNATVWMRADGQCYQTTPSQRCGRVTKPPGYRSVQAIPLSADDGDDVVRDHHVTLHSRRRGASFYFVTEAPLGDRGGGGDVVHEHALTIEAAFVRDCCDSTNADAEEYVPVWQWNRRTHNTTHAHEPSIFHVQDAHWQSYAENVCRRLTEHFRPAQEAQQSGGGGATVPSPPLDITIGCRTYQIVPLPGGVFAKQVDVFNNKMRLVRCKFMTARDASAMRAAITTDTVGECALCLEDFAATAEMPSVALPCHHAFHAACIQQIADQYGACPLCRATPDDWALVMARGQGTVGTCAAGR